MLPHILSAWKNKFRAEAPVLFTCPLCQWTLLSSPGHLKVWGRKVLSVFCFVLFSHQKYSTVRLAVLLNVWFFHCYSLPRYQGESTDAGSRVFSKLSQCLELAQYLAPLSAPVSQDKSLCFQWKALVFHTPTYLEKDLEWCHTLFDLSLNFAYLFLFFYAFINY